MNNKLATRDEIKEVEAAGKFSAPNHDPNCKRKHLILRYAFKQEWPGFPAIDFWHVISEGKSKHSTLSLEGLKEWGLI